MADVNFFDTFDIKWAQTGNADPFDIDQYKLGWAFIGSSPPSVEQFNAWGQISDEKHNWFYGQMFNAAEAADLTLTAGNLNSLRDIILELNPEKASEAEALALTNPDKFITPETLGAVVETIPTGLPVGSPDWWPLRSSIQAGYAALDGQELDQATFPDFHAMLVSGLLPTVAEATWQSDPTQRGKFVVNSSTGKFRLADYNGKSVGSLGAVFQRGDGALSAGTNGLIQRDALQNVIGTIDLRRSSPMSTVAAASGAFESLSGGVTDATNTILSGTFASNRLVLDLSKSGARTSTETRGLNVTGCWVIKLFGTVLNPGSADAAQLASDYAALQADKLDKVDALGGSGQDWTDVSASRSIGITYTNSTGKPIEVKICGNSASASAASLSFYVDELRVGIATSSATSWGTSTGAIVPDGSSYRTVNTGATFTVSTWAELRG